MNPLLLTVLHFVFCSVIAWAAICRLNITSRQVLFSERFKYVVLLVGSTGSGLQGPFFGEMPGRADVLLAATVCVYVVLGIRRWRYGPPADAFAPLKGH